MSSSADRTVGHENAALDEIDLTGELMIAATASSAERLPTARIDEVLLLQTPPGGPAGEQGAAGERADEGPTGSGPVSSAAAG
ncbi:hypothetical protein [Kitasatospora nipponensis]|uniref:hypothetical protein n=1 Tax=Kitasatospora nipponensis TaxID=258049 RepID=UPI0031CF37A5